MKEIEWYGISVSDESKMIILWKSRKEPEKTKIGENLVLDTSRGKVAFPKARCFKVTSGKTYDDMMKYVEYMKERVSEWKDYSVQVH